jgi:DNA-binding MarR family transcriptional regulator
MPSSRLLYAGFLRRLGRVPARFVKPETAASQDDRPLVTAIGLVRQLSRAMIDELTERLAAAGFSGMTASYHPVFENIDPGGTRLTDLAARAGMTHQSMGELVAALERRGYLERRADPADGRARLVCLTRQGRQLVRRAVREISDIEASWQRRFQAAGCQDFTGALQEALAGHIR